MISTRQLTTIGAVLAIAVSGIALAQTAPDHHSMGPDQQKMMESGRDRKRRVNCISPT
jgi:hypothetical protein